MSGDRQSRSEPTTDAPTTAEAAIEVAELAVRFGRYLALEKLTFDLPGGAFMTIVGPNGGGKSTLLRTIMGLIEPAGGVVRVFGGAPERARPEWIGYVPQAKTLDRRFPARSIELVGTGLRARWPGRLRPAERDRAVEALERVGMPQLAERPLNQLSGGELQRVYLARALVRRPRLILLDEPAAGMDVAGEADMYAVLEEYQTESAATVVMITHDWDAMHHHASHVLVLNRRPISFGHPDRALDEDALERAFGHVGHHHKHEHRYVCSHTYPDSRESEDPRP